MKILLIDADSVIPNLPLMKLGGWHKSKGDDVTLHKCNLPYYPTRKKITYYTPHTLFDEFDIIYCSVVFDGNVSYVKGKNIIFGGTGFDLNTTLPDEIEHFEPDYSLYPNNNTSYGFITRGCIRNCSFCKVPKKEGYIHKVNNIDDIVRHKQVKFLDNNILAFPDHEQILQELVDKKIKCQFNQGLDIRLLNERNSKLLSELNYWGVYTFAFDSYTYKDIIEEKMSLLKWAKDWQLRFFVYVHPDMSIRETVQRIIFLKNHKCLPYVMRDISCWDSVYNPFYIDICSYTNQVNFFKKSSFQDFLIKRHTSKSSKYRIEQSLMLWNENGGIKEGAEK